MTISFCLVLLLLPQLAFASPVQAQPNENPSSYDANRPQFLSANNLYAHSAALIDVNSGRILFSKKADTQLYPASITKVMTAILALEHLNLDDTVVTSKKAATIGDSSLYLVEGEEITVRDALYGLILRSGNDCGIVLAEAVAGSVEDFAVMMNEKAKELGCTNSNFNNPHGLPDENHYVTASDYALIIREAAQNPTFCEIISATKYTVPATNKDENPKSVSTKVQMIEQNNTFYYEPLLGGKTGYTKAAQYSFVGVGERDGIKLAVVILGGTVDGKWHDTKKLLEYGFANYSAVSLADMYGGAPLTTGVQGGSKDDSGSLELAISQDTDPSQLMLLVSETEKQDIIANFSQYCELKTDGTLVAPIQQGQRVATLTFQYGGMEPVEIGLCAARTIATDIISVTPPPSAASQGLSQTGLFVRTEQGDTTISPLIFLVVVPAALFLILVVWLLIEIGRYSKVRKKKKLKARDEAIRQQYEQTRRRRNDPFETTIRITTEDRTRPRERGLQREDLSPQTQRRASATLDRSQQMERRGTQSRRTYSRSVVDTRKPRRT